MKQRKVKKELGFVTYKDYVRHFGVTEGARRWRRKESTASVVSKPKKVAPAEIVEEVKDVPIEQMPQEKAEGDIEYRGKEIRKMLRTEGWHRYVEPQMKLIIKQYKDVYDDVQDIVELKVNQRIRKILQAVLDYPRDCIEDAEIVKKERKEREDAINSGGA